MQRDQALKARDLAISLQPVWPNEPVRAELKNMGEARTRTGYQFRSMVEAGPELAASAPDRIKDVQPDLTIGGGRAACSRP